MASHRLGGKRKKGNNTTSIFEENFNREKYGSKIRNAQLSPKRSLLIKSDV
jgi:hypothetical protein